MVLNTIKQKVNFSDNLERLEYARCFVNNRINSLKNDIDVCLSNKQPATFPALIYCFSTIDLLGVLSFGDGLGRRNGKVNSYLCSGGNYEWIGVTEMSKRYMIDFMKYSYKSVEKLQNVFRHKLVHLAIPSPSEKVGWEIQHRSNCHLAFETLKKKELIITWLNIEVEIKYKFYIGIWNLFEDIDISTKRYLMDIEKNSHLQMCFDNAINNIYFGPDL